MVLGLIKLLVVFISVSYVYTLIVPLSRTPPDVTDYKYIGTGVTENHKRKWYWVTKKPVTYAGASLCKYLPDSMEDDSDKVEYWQSRVSYIAPFSINADESEEIEHLVECLEKQDIDSVWIKGRESHECHVFDRLAQNHTRYDRKHSACEGTRLAVCEGTTKKH